MSAVEARTCDRDGCDVVLVRRPNEPAGRFAARRNCSRACSAKIAGAARAAAVAAAIPERTCGRAACSKPLVRGEEERVADFKRRTYCGQSCASRAHNERVVDELQRHCIAPGCGKVLTRRETEARSSFLRRSTCDRRCGGAVAHRTMGHGQGADRADAGVRSSVVGAKASPIRRRVDLDAFGEPRTDKVWRPASFAGRPDVRPRLEPVAEDLADAVA